MIISSVSIASRAKHLSVSADQKNDIFKWSRKKCDVKKKWLKSFEIEPKAMDKCSNPMRWKMTIIAVQSKTTAKERRSDRDAQTVKIVQNISMMRLDINLMAWPNQFDVSVSISIWCFFRSSRISFTCLQHVENNLSTTTKHKNCSIKSVNCVFWPLRSPFVRRVCNGHLDGNFVFSLSLSTHFYRLLCLRYQLFGKPIERRKKTLSNQIKKHLSLLLAGVRSLFKSSEPRRREGRKKK